MTKASIDLQDLRRRLYVKAKAEPSWRFWGLYVHVCKMETLRAAYAMAKQNDGAPGIDGVTFEAIEAQGVEALLEQLRDELTGRTYKPLPVGQARPHGAGVGRVRRAFRERADAGRGLPLAWHPGHAARLRPRRRGLSRPVKVLRAFFPSPVSRRLLPHERLRKRHHREGLKVRGLVWGFSCQVVIFGLLAILCSERECRSSSRRLRSGSRSGRKGSRDRNASKAWRLAA